jgi:hypothetical protein
VSAIEQIQLVFCCSCPGMVLRLVMRLGNFAANASFTIDNATAVLDSAHSSWVMHGHDKILLPAS